MTNLEEYKKAIENTNIVSKTDINGIITFVNDEFCKLSGYSKEELIGKNHNIIRHPDVDKSEFERLWNTILAGKVHKAIVKNKKKNGEAFWAQTTIIPLFDDNNQICEFIAIRHDITKIFELNEELEKTKAQLLSLNENLEQKIAQKTKSLKLLNENLEQKIQNALEKNNEQQKIIFQQNRQIILGQMLENIAHQWRQPLNELSLALYLLHSENSKKHYKLCQKLIQNMSQTINDFRDFVNSNTKIKLNYLPKILKSSLQICYNAVKKSKIKLVFNIDKNTYESPVKCNFNEISQVLVNIINNAKDALNQSKTTREICFDLYQENEQIILKITDNAGGISENIQDFLFDPYFSTKHKKQGVGLGLYICKQILEHNNAKISCYNEKNGACFQIIFDKEKQC